MKRLLQVAQYLLLIILLVCFTNVNAQSTTAANTLPPFRILLTNMQYLKAAELDKNSPKVIIYFDPTCEHCKVFTKDLLTHVNDLSKTQIVMISYTPIDQVKKFANELNLAKYINIKIGTEGTTFIVRRFYNVQRFPFVALHDKTDVLIATYKEPATVNELLQKVKKM